MSADNPTDDDADVRQPDDVAPATSVDRVPAAGHPETAASGGHSGTRSRSEYAETLRSAGWDTQKPDGSPGSRDAAAERQAPEPEKGSATADASGPERTDDAPGSQDLPAIRNWPADPVTGEELTEHDLDFLGLTSQEVEWWRNGEAPLGMAPESYSQWKQAMRDALRSDEVPPDEVDVRLLGSSARAFSGPHKQIPEDHEIIGSRSPDVAQAALARKADWLGADPQRLQSRPFDAMSKLGLDDPSDYDTNLSSDLMVDKARAEWQAAGQQGSFWAGDHQYVSKEIAERAFPHVKAWADTWTSELGREVTWAVFPGTGPKDMSASGHIVHFQESDWIVQRREGS